MHHIVRARVASTEPSPAPDPRDVLSALREHSGTLPAGEIVGRAAVRDLLHHAWADLNQVLATELDEPTPALAAALANIQMVDNLLLERLEARADVPGRLAEVIGRLEAAPCTTDDLVTLAPRLICELGFDRAIISRVDDGLWVSECVYVPEDPQWAEAINKVGQETPQQLGPRIHETEIVRRREGLLVTDVQTDSRVNRPIADASRSRSYVAAPVISDGTVVGLLHADKYLRNADVSDDDCQLLIGFAQSFRLALSRARMSEDLGSALSGLDALTSALTTTADSAHKVTIRRAPAETTPAPTRFPTQRSGPDRDQTRSRLAAVAGLTKREVEVFGLMAQGRTNGAIARELVISEGTVKQHVKHVLRKLRARNRSEAVSIWFSEVDSHS